MTTTTKPNEILAPPSVVRGVVVAVNSQNYSCRVAFDSQHDLDDVYWLSASNHLDRGAGINVMPEPGDMCWAAFPADGSIPFILGFMTLGDQENGTGETPTDISYKGQRPALNPGDIHMGTRDGNFMILRRGGIVQIGASYTAQTAYIPIEGLIRSYFMKYHGFSPLGEVVWDHARIDQTTTITEASDIPVLLKFSCRDKLQDKKSSVEIRMGRLTEEMLDTSVDANLLQEGKKTTVEFLGESGKVSTENLDQGDGDKEHLMGAAQKETGIGFTKYSKGSPSGLLSMVLNPNGSGIKFSFQLDKDGSLFMRSEAHVHIEAADTAFLSAENRVRIETGSDASVDLTDAFKAAVKTYLIEILKEGVINIQGNSVNLNASTGDIEIEAGGDLVLKSGGKIALKAGTIELGNSPKFDFLVNAKAWKAALAGHQHTAPAGGGPTTFLGPVTPSALTTRETPSKILVG